MELRVCNLGCLTDIFHAMYLSILSALYQYRDKFSIKILKQQIDSYFIYKKRLAVLMYLLLKIVIQTFNFSRSVKGFIPHIVYTVCTIRVCIQTNTSNIDTSNSTPRVPSLPSHLTFLVGF